MADSGTKTFGSILSDGLYRIPNYQRGYAWTADEVNDLLDDLEYVTDNEAIGDHYLNSIIVAEPEREEATDVVHVIDGQQRLLTSNLLANEILRKAVQLDSTDNQTLNHLREQVEGKLYNDVFKSSPSRIRRRTLPAEEHQSVFKRLVPEKLENDRDLNKIDEEATSPSEEKLVKAVKTINGRIDDMIETEAEESRSDQLIYLDRLASTLHKSFTATLHEVESPSEAGRIFEAINDRGRSLNRADKIKSYLVYRATLGTLSIDVRDIHETFTYLYETLNSYASDPARVDTLADKLISQHWNMFAGEDQIARSEDLIGRHEKASADLDQIKHAKYHAPKEGDSSRIEQWMEVYLNSLKKAADAYVQIRGPDQEPLFTELESQLPKGADVDAIRHNLYAIETFGPSTTHALSIAAYIRFLEDDTYARVVESLEKVVIRMFGVGGARRDTKRSDFESLSRVLFWQGRNDLTDVFPEGSSIPSGVVEDAEEYGIDGTLDDANRIIEHLNQWAYDYSHESEDGTEIDVFKRRLSKDNLDGLAVAGWGGLSSNELKNYMLYQYEGRIRQGGANLPKYLEADIYDYTVEHVWPENRCENGIALELDDDDYARYVERLGNLAFLSLSENSSAGNQDYETKWDRAYKEAADGTKMVREEFPDPTGSRSNEATSQGFDSWEVDVIEWRSERMAEVLAKHWECFG